MTAVGLSSGHPSLRPAQHVLLQEENPALRRWIGAGVVILLLHAALLFWILHARDSSASGAEPAVVLFELAPADVAPPSPVPPETQVGPQMTEAQPEEAEKPQTVTVPELPTAPKPAVVLMPSKPKPHPKKIDKELPKSVKPAVHELPKPRTSAPAQAAAAAERAAARAATAAEASAWTSNWSAALSWAKSYPASARARGEQGIVRLALTVGSSGHVISARVISSSGYPDLDQAALEMARKASGKPPPPEMGGSVNLTVPIRYHLN